MLVALVGGENKAVGWRAGVGTTPKSTSTPIPVASGAFQRYLTLTCPTFGAKPRSLWSVAVDSIGFSLSLGFGMAKYRDFAEMRIASVIDVDQCGLVCRGEARASV